MAKVIDNLTKAEQEKLLAIDAKYRPLLDAATKEVAEALSAFTEEHEKGTQTEETAKRLTLANDKEALLHEQWLKERSAVTEQAEIRLFNSYNGDVKAIVAMIKAEIPRHIAFIRIFADVDGKPTEEDRAQAQKRIKEEAENIKKGIAVNKKLLENNPGDIELIKATRELEEMLTSGSYKEILTPHYDIVFSDDNIRESIFDGFKRYLNFLKENAPKEYKSLLAYINTCIANKELVADQYSAKPEEIEEAKKEEAYRTKSKATEAGALSSIPTSLAIPTMEQYKYSMSLYQSGGAYLQPLTSTDGLKFKGGKMYFDNMQQVSEVELQNMKTKEGIEAIDLSLLRVFYSIILSAFEASKCTELKDVITLFVPDLAEYLGLQRNLNKQDIARVISKAQSFHNIVGVLHGTRNGKPSQSLYPVLNFEGYDDKKNTIAFSSPYMNMVIRTVYNLSIRKTKDGKPKLKKSGEPMRLVSHSYLVHSSITKQRNKAAVENVNIIVTLIEQAGDNIPRIKAKTIIERNPQLQQRLKNDPTHSAQLLKRVFSKTWELLRTETDLLTTYKEIELPDPKNPAYIPTLKTLDTLVFSFPHKGKK